MPPPITPSRTSAISSTHGVEARGTGYAASAPVEELATFIEQRLRNPGGFNITSIDSIRQAALELCPVGRSVRQWFQRRLDRSTDDDFVWTATAEQWARALVSAIVDVDEYCARIHPVRPTDQPTDMTKFAQRAAVAKALGWKLRWQNCGGGPLFDSRPKGHCWEVWCDPTGLGVDKKNCNPVDPPDYLNNRDAIHEALSLIKGAKQEGAFLYYLSQILWDSYEDKDRHLVSSFDMIKATPEQLAKAILETLELWTP